MELRDYIKILVKYCWIIIIFALLTSGVSYYLVSKTKPVFTGYKNLVVSKKTNSVSSDYYQYDGYYLAEAASLQAKNLSIWLGSSSTIIDIYGRSGQNVSIADDKQVKSLIAVKNDPSSSVIVVSSKDEDKALLENRLKAIDTVSADYLKSIDKENAYEIQISDIVIAEGIVKTKTNTFAGFLSGLIIGIVIAFGVEYFKADKQTK